MQKQILIVIVFFFLSLGLFYAVLVFMPKPENNINFNNMKITSSVFEDGEFIPSKYTCDGQGINPSLEFSEIPANAKSLALLIDDPDAPGGDWVHWLVWNIDPQINNIEAGVLPVGAVEGENSSGENKYSGPCPPSGVHNYVFKFYALDMVLADLSNKTDKQKFLKLIENHVVGFAKLVGKYSR